MKNTDPLRENFNVHGIGNSRDGMTFYHFPIADIRDLKDLTAHQSGALAKALIENSTFRLTLKDSQTRTGVCVGNVEPIRNQLLSVSQTGMGTGPVGGILNHHPVIEYDPDHIFFDSREITDE